MTTAPPKPSRDQIVVGPSTRGIPFTTSLVVKRLKCAYADTRATAVLCLRNFPRSMQRRLGGEQPGEPKGRIRTGIRPRIRTGNRSNRNLHRARIRTRIRRNRILHRPRSRTRKRRNRILHRPRIRIRRIPIGSQQQNEKGVCVLLKNVGRRSENERKSY